MKPIYICPKCGKIDGININTCMICGHKMIKFEPEMDWIEVCMFPLNQQDEISLQFQSQEQYDQMAWLHRVHVMQGRELECWHPQFDYRYKPGVVLPECPYCHQYWTEKISAGSRLLSAGIFGLGSKKIGKQWHCYFCDSDF